MNEIYDVQETDCMDEFLMSMKLTAWMKLDHMDKP